MTPYVRRFVSFAAYLVVVLSITALHAGNGAKSRNIVPAHLEQEYGKLPLSFEANQGQIDGRVRFLSRSPSSALFLTGDEAVLEIVAGQSTRGDLAELPSLLDPADSLLGRKPPGMPLRRASRHNSTAAVLRIKLIGADARASSVGEDQLPGKINYLLGNDPAKWRTEVPTFAKVQYLDVYPGIDLVYYGNQSGRLEHDFIVHPGADVDSIELAFEGTSRLQINGAGDLNAIVGTTAITLQRPVVYQLISGTRREIKGGYRLGRDNRVSFAVGSYDRRRELVIDPVLTYSTFLSTDTNTGLGITTDSAGNAYIVGTTQATQFPTTSGVFQASCPNPQNPNGGCYSPFVAKLSPDGSKLLYSTYLGGTSNVSTATAVAVDSSGNAYITGYTIDPNFPVTANAYQSLCGGYLPGPPAVCVGDSAFVSELNTTGTALLYSTYLSGGHQLSAEAQEVGSGIAVDSSGNSYASGVTTSTDFPIVNGFQTTLGDTKGLCNPGNLAIGDLYLAKFGKDSGGNTTLLYSTFIGGSGQEGPTYSESGNSLAVDSSGRAYVTGYTSSVDFPTSPNGYQLSCGTDGNCNGMACTQSAGDAVITNIDTTKAGAASLLYSSYIGGSGADFGVGVAADNSGDAYLAGWSQSSDFPTTAGSFESCNQPYSSTQSYVTKLNTSLSGAASLVYSGCLGENSGAQAFGIAADSSGKAYVTGILGNAYAPFTLINPIESQGGLFASAISADGSTLLWSTLFGNSLAGGNGDQPYGAMTVDSGGNVYFTGSLTGGGSLISDLPTTAGSYSPTCDPNKGCSLYPGVGQFIAKISQGDGSTASLGPWNPIFAETDVNTHSQVFSLSLRDMGDQPFNISNIVLGGTNAGDFSQTNNCPVGGQLSAASQCTISLTFTPTATGARSATVTVTDTAPMSPHVATISATGDNITFFPSSLSFPATSVGQTSAAKAITLTNVATTRTLTIYSVSASGNFIETDTCAGMSLAPNASCTINVTFMPTVQGTISGSISVSDAGTSVVQNVSLSGSGSVGLSFSPASLNFGTVPVGMTSASKSVTVSNNLTSTASSLAFSASGNYSVAAGGAKPCGNSLAVKASCTVNVAFTPTTNGSIKGDIAFSYSGGTASPQVYTLAGSGSGGPAAPLTFSPTSLTIVNPVIGTASAASTVTVTNVSASALTINSLTTNGNFSATPSGATPCNGRLNAGGKCSFSVTFTPASSGTVTDAVTITDSAAVGAQTYALTGNSLPVSLSPTALTFPATSISGGNSGPLTVTITNNQTTSVTLNTFTTSGEFSQGGGTCVPGIVLSKHGKCTLQLFFTPTVIGTIKGAVTITHTAIGSPQEVSLSGTGTF